MDTPPHHITVDPLHVLSFEPEAIREHFAGDDDPQARWVATASDEQLADVAEECLGSDTVYEAFRRSLRDAVEEQMG